MKIHGWRPMVAVTLLVVMMQPAAVQAGDVTLRYRLPQATVGFAVSHTITRCPDSQGQGFEMDVMTAIKPVYRAGETVNVNAAGNLFVDRTVKIEYYDNGTIKSFNGTSAGQGGKLVAAGIKLASFIAASSVGVPLPPAWTATSPVLTCHQWVKEALAGKRQAQAYLASLEGQIVAAGLSDRLAEEIATARAQIAAFDALLTILGDPVYWTPAANSLSFNSTASSGDLGEWFSVVPGADLATALSYAGYGQTQQYTLSGSFASPPTPDDISRLGTRSLIYREPVRATVSMKPSQPFSSPATRGSVAYALASQRYEATEQSLKPKIPQMGPVTEVRFDGSGIFGSRGVSATFAETGEVTALGYSSTGGADALAGVVDAVTASAGELRDARLAAITREIELRTKEQELLDLIDEEAPVPQ